MPPTWLTVLAWISLASAFVCAGLIAVDIFVRGYRQHVWIMDVVWPLTALYSGPPGWLAYRRWGRLNSRRYRQQSGVRGHYPYSVSVGISDTHCGAAVLRLLYRSASEAGPRRVLVSDAGGDDSRVSDRVSGEQLADQARDQGGNVSAAPLEVLARPVPSRGGIPTSARAAA